MAVRLLLAATVLALAGCGSSSAQREVRVLAPPWIETNIAGFERESGCRVDLRVYDEDEELEPIARRRDVDVIATVTRDPRDGGERFVAITLSGGVVVTIPERLSSAFDGPRRPAGTRAIRWTVRKEGDNPDCARRWVAYATSQ